MTEEIKDILDFLLYNDKLTTSGKRKLRDYITNLQQENERLLKQLEDISLDEASIRADVLLKQQDYKSRCEKANWWLEEMLKQAKSNETKAIINGTLDLLLNGRSDE